MKSWVPREFKQTYYSTKSPLNRRFFDRQTTHFPDPLVLAINYTSRLTATGTGQLSGATRAIIINQACPTSAGASWQNCTDFCPLPLRARGKVAGECVGYVTFPEQLFHPRTHAADSISQGNSSSRYTRFSLPPFCERTLLYSATERKREY